MNIGLLAGGSYALYTRPRLRRDTRVIISVMATTFALFGAERHAIRSCRSSPKNVKDWNTEEGSGAACHRIREHVPGLGISGGATGLGKPHLMHKLKPISVPWTVHAGILSIVGYLAYRNRDSPKWDRRAVIAASVGLLALWGGEMYPS